MPPTPPPYPLLISSAVARLWLPSMSLHKNDTPPPANAPYGSTPVARYGWPTESSESFGRYGDGRSGGFGGSPAVGLLSCCTSAASPGRFTGGSTAVCVATGVASGVVPSGAGSVVV